MRIDPKQHAWMAAPETAVVMSALIAGSVTWVVFEGLRALDVDAFYRHATDEPPSFHTLLLAGILGLALGKKSPIAVAAAPAYAGAGWGSGAAPEDWAPTRERSAPSTIVGWSSGTGGWVLPVSFMAPASARATPAGTRFPPDPTLSGP